MDLTLTAEQTLLRDTARELANKEIAPKAAEIDKQHRFPKEQVARLAEMGLMGVAIPQEWGGAGMDAVSYVLALEEISRACASTGVIMSVNNSLVCDPILKFGTDAQKTRFLIPLASGKKLGCFALSEPGAGSDAAALTTTARRDGDLYIINGTKNFITNGPVSDVVLLFAVTQPGIGHGGLTAFLVDSKTPGLQFGPPDDKLGIRGALSSQLFLTDCAVPADALLGQPGGGFKLAMSALDGGRIGIASQALGIARAAFEAATRYSKERKTFGQTLSEHQAIQFKLADMCTEIDAARLLIWRAAAKKDEKGRFSLEASMAKLFAAEMANRVVTQALQVFGGYGYLGDFPAERHFRDARITEIYEGTSEIQRLVIASAILKS